MDDDIRLDKQAFRALASETRVAVLKQLAQRRKTLTELSTALAMAPSTLKEHLDSLKAADLVILIDDGHKWKYYELTRKGRGVLNPGERKVLVLLAVSLLAALAFGIQLTPATTLSFAEKSLPSAQIGLPAEIATPADAASIPAPAQAPSAPLSAPLPALFGLAASIAIALGAASVLISRRAKSRA